MKRRCKWRLTAGFSASRQLRHGASCKSDATEDWDHSWAKCLWLVGPLGNDVTCRSGRLLTLRLRFHQRLDFNTVYESQKTRSTFRTLHSPSRHRVVTSRWWRLRMTDDTAGAANLSFRNDCGRSNVGSLLQGVCWIPKTRNLKWKPTKTPLRCLWATRWLRWAASSFQFQVVFEGLAVNPSLIWPLAVDGCCRSEISFYTRLSLSASWVWLQIRKKRKTIKQC